MEHDPRGQDDAIERYRQALEADGGDPATALGAQYGEEGIALEAALDELTVLHRAVAGTPPSDRMLRSLAIAWAEATTGQLLTRGALDQRTGLATLAFLSTRLRDLARTGEHAARRLVAITPAPARGSRLRDMLRTARIAGALRESFPLGETPVGLPEARLAVIAPLEPGFEANLVRARLAIGAIDEPPASVGAIVLPASEAAIPAFVRRL